MNDILFYFILIVSLFNLFRMAAYLVGSDIYTIKHTTKGRLQKRDYLPYVTVFVPAHNEEYTVTRSLESLYNTRYPSSRLEVIVVNDGSTDGTKKVVQKFQRKFKDRCRFRLLNRPNRGKAGALNYAMNHTKTGSLIMCLDADSGLDKDALRNAVQHFHDKKVVALSSNVNIIEDKTIMSLVQRFEYLVCYQMKKAQAHFGLEYIIGGIGSMFRRNMLKKVSFYDTNTMTEDIDLTMKILVNKKMDEKIAYAADSIVHTEAAHTLSELMKQRFRWKYGRMQTFFKNSSFFFSRDKTYPKRLTWFMLPFSLLQDLMFFAEPFIIVWFVYILVAFGDTRTLISASIVITTYLLFNIWSSTHLSTLQRLRLSLLAPAMYILMFILTFAEYYALVKSTIMVRGVKQSLQVNHIVWKSPERRKL